MNEVETLEYSGRLTVVRCWCGIAHAVPEELRRFQLHKKNEGKEFSVYCPLGHGYVPVGESEVKKLESRLARAVSENDQIRAALKAKEGQLNAARRSRAAVVGQVTKIKNRIAAGVCPCCRRPFSNLARHMKGKHPEFAKDDDSKPGRK